MKNYNQVYVKNSFDAAKIYYKAFGAEITRAFINKNNTAYEHRELKKGVVMCGDCLDMEKCQMVGMIISNNPDALKNLRG